MNDQYREYLTDGQRVGARYILAKPRNAPAGLAGLQLGNRSGASLEFKEHRDYQPGDDLRRIDWSAYARSDKYIVKLFREEVNPHVDLIIDGTASMALAKTAKVQGTLGLAGIIASAASNSDYSHSAWITSNLCLPVIRGDRRPSEWDEINFTATATPTDAFQKGQPNWPNNGIRIFISDLLWLGDPSDVLNSLAHNASAVYVIQVLAEADVNPMYRGNIRLVDCETGDSSEIFIDSSAEKRYRNALVSHQTNWHRTARQVGAVMTTIVAEQMLDGWNLNQLIESEVLELP